MIWVQHSELAWVAGSVEHQDEGKITVRLGPDGSNITLSGTEMNYDAVSKEELEIKCENLVELERINEGIILHHIKTRFAGRKIYTLVGAILVAVNPYQSIAELYKDDVMEKIRRRVRAGVAAPIPHVFTIAAVALTDLTNLRGDQSVLISGESGAGKTETTKKLLQYFSSCNSGKKTQDVSSAILDSNPILEAFGNAKTLRNNNSSRFGKYMEVNYKRGEKSGEIVGCKCVSYLLEKSRVVHQTPGERNYHIFYMLLSSITRDPPLASELRLKKAKSFKYLNQSGCYEIDGRDDDDELAILKSSFDHVGFSAGHTRQIFQCLAGILHLGNVGFIEQVEGRAVVDPACLVDLRTAVELFEMQIGSLEVGAELLQQAICTIQIRGGVGGETLERPLSVAQAVNNRDTLAKAIYDKVFDKIVYQVNKSLFVHREPGWNIGVLDIFGFEVFEVNSFEQLCINYCNEKLQTFFNDVIFDSELKYYRSEDVSVDDITYKDNNPCVSLIDAKMGGIFSQVADIAVNKGATDDDLCKKLFENFLEKATTKSEYFVRSKKRGTFAVKHFAGDVTYTVNGFIEKNKDKLPDALASAMERCFLPLLNDGDAAAWDSWRPTARGRNKLHEEESTNKVSVHSGRQTARLPLASKFKLDLDSLVAELRKTTPQFIRCVKPNDRQQPNALDPVLTLNQLKYSGLFEAIRIRQSGYPLRMTHEQFIVRYKHCFLGVAQREKSNPRSYAHALMSALSEMVGFSNVPGEPRNYAIGLSKVFIRKDAMGHALDVCREANADNIAIPIQKLVRGFLGRRKVFHLVGEARRLEQMIRRNEERERIAMSDADRQSVKLNEARRKKEAMDRAAEEQRAEQKRLAKERRLAEETKVARLWQRLYFMWRDGVRGRKIMAERALEQALQQQNHLCADCKIGRPCPTHHTSSCNNSTLERILSDAIASNSASALQEAVRCADDACVSPSTKCACLFVKSEARPLYLPKSFRPILLLPPTALSSNHLFSLYSEASRDLQRHKREGSTFKRSDVASRGPVFCDCRLNMLKLAVSRPSASCKVCRSYTASPSLSVPHEHRCVRSRKILTLMATARSVIMDTLAESYLRQALQDALTCGSDVLLRDATDKAESSTSSTSTSIATLLREARDALSDQSRLKATLGNLTQDLLLATTVPKLLERVDSIRIHILEAKNLGLGGEAAVAEAVMRLGKIKSLVALRDKMRAGVEICSLSLMDRLVLQFFFFSPSATDFVSLFFDHSAMQERERLIPLFGSELLEIEARSVVEMRRMLSYLHQIRDSTTLSTSGKEGGDGDDNFSGGGAGGADRMLPRYVSQALEKLREADSKQNSGELEEAMNHFATIIPNESVRRKYRRIFKWVVAYAPWKFDHQRAPEQVEEHTAETINVSVDRYGGKRFHDAGGHEELQKFLAFCHSPGHTFASPVKMSQH